MQKILKIHRVDPEENASQTDGQMNRTDLVGHLMQSWRFSHVFRKFENKIWKEYKKKEPLIAITSAQRPPPDLPSAKKVPAEFKVKLS